MIINLKKLGEQAIESTTSQKKMRLSENATSMVFQLFTKNVYSNPIGTIVREITSNCFDSHVEAGVTDVPVIIKKSVDKETETDYISFIDFGVGMSPERIYDIYGVYFESTKRVDNEQIGGFGIGGKTPLAYKRSTGLGEGEYDNSFYVITNYDGRKYFYMIYEGMESPEISLLHDEPTKEGNGTEIRIPVLKKDVGTFAREMQRQLYYFENIVFEGFEEYGTYVRNDYQILQGKSFLFRGTEYDGSIHVCLGRVAYPIDYNALNLNRNNYYIPIALKLDVGDIGVTVSRESLDYSEKTIKVLKEKLEEAKNEIVSILSKQYSNIVSLEDYFEVKNNFGKLKLANTEINLSNFINEASVDFKNFRFNEFKNIPHHKTLFTALFKYKRCGDKERIYKTVFSGGWNDLKKFGDKVYYVDGSVFNRKMIKQSYLKQLHKRYFVITKQDIGSNYVIGDLADLFKLKHSDLVLYDEVTDIETTTPLYDKLIALRDEYFEIVKKYCAGDYDTLEIPDDFTINRKRNTLTPDVLKSTIPVKFIGGYGRNRVPVKDLVEFNGTIFYGMSDDESKLNIAHKLFRRLFNSDYVVTSYGSYYKSNPFGLNTKAGIMFVMVAKNNLKFFERHCKKAFHVDNFKHKMLYRKEDMVMNYYNVDVLLDKYNRIGELYKPNVLSNINQQWADFAQEIKDEIDAIPTAVKNIDLKLYSHELGQFFDLSKALPVDKKLSEKIELLQLLEKANEQILSYIQLPYYHDRINTNNNPVLIDVLKKVMNFNF